MLKEYIKHVISLYSLNELKIIDLGVNENVFNVFVFQGLLFKYPIELSVQDIEESILAHYNEKESIKNIFDDIADGNLGGDWLEGTVDEQNKTLFLKSSFSHTHNPKTSKIVRDVVKEFGLKKVSKSSFDPFTEENDETTFREYEIQNKIPDIAYHGTNSKSLLNILQVGLRPGAQMGKTGFKKAGVWHDETIFLEFDINETKFYAQNAATQHGGFPIVLGIRIPDKERIMPDYDIDVMLGKTTYGTGPTKSYGMAKHRKAGPLKTSLTVGRIGYAGRIPPKFIEEFYYYSKFESTLIQTTKEKLLQMIEVADKFGDEHYEESLEDLVSSEDD